MEIIGADSLILPFSPPLNPRLPDHINQKIRDLIINELLNMEEDLSDGYHFYCHGSVHEYLGEHADKLVTIINNYIQND